MHIQNETIIYLYLFFLHSFSLSLFLTYSLSFFLSLCLSLSFSISPGEVKPRISGDLKTAEIKLVINPDPLFISDSFEALFNINDSATSVSIQGDILMIGDSIFRNQSVVFQRRTRKSHSLNISLVLAYNKSYRRYLFPKSLLL